MSPYDDNWNGEPPERTPLIRRALGWKPVKPQHSMTTGVVIMCETYEEFARLFNSQKDQRS